MKKNNRKASLRAVLLTGAILGTFALPSSAAAREVVITFGGDVSANRSRVAPEPGGTRFGRRLVRFGEWTAKIRPLLNGDINFINLETVISPRQLWTRARSTRS